ncbi:hypothetical protein Bca101_036195 [Brassica carinata]
MRDSELQGLSSVFKKEMKRNEEKLWVFIGFYKGVKIEEDIYSPIEALIVDQAHMNPRGVFLPQALRRRLRETGTLSLIPRTFAFKAVQRQAAASRSTKPLRSEQQGLTGGEPSSILRRSFRTLAQTPSLRVFLGQLPEEDGVGVGLGLGFGMEPQPPPQAVVSVKKKMLNVRKMIREAEFLEAIFPKINFKLSNGGTGKYEKYYHESEAWGKSTSVNGVLNVVGKNFMFTTWGPLVYIPGNFSLSRSVRQELPTTFLHKKFSRPLVSVGNFPDKYHLSGFFSFPMNFGRVFLYGNISGENPSRSVFVGNAIFWRIPDRRICRE